MFEVQHCTSDQLAPEIAAQISSFIRLVWLNDWTGDDRFWDLLPPNPNVHHFYIAERGVLVSHALVRHQPLTHLGETYQLCGVGGVFTYPAFRSEGHGRRVVEAATAHIRESGRDIGMLFTDPALTSFYGEHGWLVLGEPGITYGDPAQPDFDDAFVMMMFVSEQGKANRAAFEHGPIYIGEHLW